MDVGRHGSPPSPVRRSRAVNLKELAAGELRKRIFSGEFRPGSKIDQDALADELGISKLPVREALITLGGEGLVRNIPRRGAYVAHVTPEDVRDHYHIYGVVSGIAAERAAERASPEVLAELRRVTDDMADERDAAVLEDLNFEFHRVVNRLGGSPWLHSVLNLLGRSIPTRFYETHEGWAAVAHRDHLSILAALERGDAAAAGAAMASHLRQGGEYAIQVLRAGGFWSQASQEGDGRVD